MSQGLITRFPICFWTIAAVRRKRKGRFFLKKEEIERDHFASSKERVCRQLHWGHSWSPLLPPEHVYSLQIASEGRGNHRCPQQFKTVWLPESMLHDARPVCSLATRSTELLISKVNLQAWPPVEMTYFIDRKPGARERCLPQGLWVALRIRVNCAQRCLPIEMN